MVTKIAPVIVAAILFGFGGMSIWFAGGVDDKEATRRFITANPLDLTQIEGFSKYRSCMGHDFRAPNLYGEVEATPRSMKHYVMIKPEFQGTIDRVSAFAPFDGIISDIDDDFGGPGDQQVWLTPRSINPRQWHFIFFHINVKRGLEKGSEVKAGDLIGTANLKRGPLGSTSNFDIAVKFMRPMHRPAIDAPFNHATQDVLDEYRKYGISASDLIIPEEERNATLCQIDPNVNYGGPDVYFSRNTSAEDYFWINNPSASSNSLESTFAPSPAPQKIVPKKAAVESPKINNTYQPQPIVQERRLVEQSSSEQENSDEPPLKLKGIGVNFEDFKFTKEKLQFGRIFMGFGFVIPGSSSSSGQAKTNPQPTYVVPLGTPVRSLIDGIVVAIPTLWSGDASIQVTADGKMQKWIYETEHLVNPKVAVGDKVVAGQIIGEVGTFGNGDPPGYGAVEIGLLKGGQTPEHVCPFAYLDDSIREETFAKLRNLFQTWEDYVGDQSLYTETEIPGCLTLELVEG